MTLNGNWSLRVGKLELRLLLSIPMPAPRKRLRKLELYVIPSADLAACTDMRTLLQRIPAGFHHEHKSHAVPIATDLDDGKPGAYDLPPPSTAGAIAATGSLKDSNGKPIANGTAGLRALVGHHGSEMATPANPFKVRAWRIIKRGSKASLMTSFMEVCSFFQFSQTPS